MPPKIPPEKHVTLVSKNKNMEIQGETAENLANPHAIVAPLAATPATANTTAAPETASTTTSQEGLLENLLSTNMLGGATCSGIQILVIQVPCDISNSKVTPDLSMRSLTIQGKELVRKSVMQVNKLTEDRITAKGCGYST